MACEQNILDIPLSASLPGADDVVIFTLPNGTSVLRKWSVLNNGSIPADIEVVVTQSGGTINNGDSTKIFSQHVGRRVRFYRNGVKQGTTNLGGSYYQFDAPTGEYTFIPAASSQELFQFEVY